jgi:hypothetical protein
MDPATSLITTKFGNQQYYAWPPPGAAEPTDMAAQYNYTNIIRRVSFKEAGSNNVPNCFEVDRIYYARRSTPYSFTITPFGLRIYLTLADALAEVNHITFTSQQVKINWQIDFPDKAAGGLACWEYGADNVEDISCCPEFQKYDLTSPGGYEIHDLYSTLFPQFPVIPLSSRIFSPVNFQSPEFMGSLNYDPFGVYLYSYVYFYYSQKNEQIDIWPGYYYIPTGAFIADLAASFKKTNNGFEKTYDGFGWNNNSFSDTLTLVPIGTTNLPQTARLYMPDAFFWDSKYPVHLGTINEVLTLDEETSTYYSQKLNLFNIPGRFHIKLDNFYPPLGTVNSKIIHAPEGTYPNGGNFPSTRSFPDDLSGININVKVWVADVNGYPKGQGIWFDTRINSNTPYAQIEKPTLFQVAYSQYNLAFGRMYGSLATINSTGVYKNNFYGVMSYHGGCYFSSLEV